MKRTTTENISEHIKKCKTDDSNSINQLTNNEKNIKHEKKLKKKKNKKKIEVTVDEVNDVKHFSIENLENNINKQKKEKSLVKEIEENESTENNVKLKKAKKKINKKETYELPEDVSKDESLVDNEDENSTKTVIKNINNKPSKRKLKKEKAELRAVASKEASQQETAKKVLNYVSQWKHARDHWKFNKLKQIWLINNFMNENYIPEEHFSNIVEYFEGCKGMARKKILEKAQLIVSKAEENYEENEEVIETTEFIRAKNLIQALPNET